MIKKIILLILTVFLILSREDIGFSRANFLDEEKSSGNTITASCWSPPSVPVLSYPTNNTFAGAGSAWDLDPYLDWEDSRLMCSGAGPISYQFESYTDAGLATLYYASGWLPGSSISVIGMPDGTYYWRVRAKDAAGYTSDFSAAWLLTIDRVIPSTPTLTVTGSWSKIVEEKITNDWIAVGDVTFLSDKTLIGKTSGTDGNYVWENRLMQSFNSGAKSLAVDYDFNTADFSFDTPGFLIRLNGQPVFSLDASGGNTGWQQWRYDLSEIYTPKINLALYAGNTGDKDYQSYVYIGKVTTEFVAAPLHATYTLSGSDTGSGIDHYEYSLDNGVNWVSFASFFTLPAGTHDLLYRSVDKANNPSPSTQLTVVTDDTAPADIVDLNVYSTASNSAVLTWTAPGNDGTSNRATKYDVRYSTSLIDDDNFSLATEVSNVFGPKDPWVTETLEILGLNPETKYYFAVKTADEAPNWSGISNVPDGTTLPGAAINYGDLVINELMWMGTASSSADEFLEIRNLTDREISLDNIKLTKSPGGVETDMISPSAFAGKKIAAKGYFLISNWASPSSALAENVVSDLVTTAIELSNTELEIKLYDGVNLIDTAGNGGAPFEGLRDGNKYYSMERTNVPGLGTDALNWYTCIDAPSHADFFDAASTGDERGTPGKENRSENEPLAHQKLLPREPELGLTISDDKKVATISAKNLKDYQKLNYELTYDTNEAPQGVVGQTDLTPDQNSFEKTVLLGTCSTGGTCVYHQNPSNFKVKIVLDMTKELNYEL